MQSFIEDLRSGLEGLNKDIERTQAELQALSVAPSDERNEKQRDYLRSTLLSQRNEKVALLNLLSPSSPALLERLVSTTSEMNERLSELSSTTFETNKKISETNKKISETNEKVDALSSALGYVVEDVLDPWSAIKTNDGSSVSTAPPSETASLSEKGLSIRTVAVLSHYEIPLDECMLLGKCELGEVGQRYGARRAKKGNGSGEGGEEGNTKEMRVMNAHLWPANSSGRGLNFLDLNAEAVNDPRNFLRLHKSLEHAFDRSQLVFETVFAGTAASAFVSSSSSPSTLSSSCTSSAPSGSTALPGEENSSSTNTIFRLRALVLDPELLVSEKRVYTSPDKWYSWSEINGKVSHYEFGGGGDRRRPFTRVIAQHFRASINKAGVFGWIEQTQMTEYRERALLLLRNSLPHQRNFWLDKEERGGGGKVGSGRADDWRHEDS